MIRTNMPGMERIQWTEALLDEAVNKLLYLRDFNVNELKAFQNFTAEKNLPEDPKVANVILARANSKWNWFAYKAGNPKQPVEG